jgi:TonB family protein
MTRVPVAFIVTVGVVALCGSTVLWAQEAPVTVRDPISPADCLKDKKKAPECQRLGVQYWTGTGVAQNVDQGIALLDAACRAGMSSSACWTQGWALLKRHASPEDVERGRALLDKECRRGASGACMLLGRAYAEGTGVARDVGRAVKPLETACAAGQGGACLILGSLFDAGDGIARDAKRAQELFSNACAVGVAEACEKACAAGAAEGCHLLAVRTKDDKRALALFERACTLDYGPGCLAAGHSYYLGRGAATDLAAAVRFYAKACEQDVRAACRALGGVYARGELGANETPKGQTYLVKACGHDVACQAIVANGRIPKDWGGTLEALRPQQVTRGDGPVRVGDSIKEPRKIRNATPVYPAQARGLGIQGTVTLDCVISPRGDVTDVRVVRSIPMLDAAAVEAVRQWRYTPTFVDGEPVRVIMTVTVNFTIS